MKWLAIGGAHCYTLARNFLLIFSVPSLLVGLLGFSNSKRFPKKLGHEFTPPLSYLRAAHGVAEPFWPDARCEKYFRR